MTQSAALTDSDQQGSNAQQYTRPLIWAAFLFSGEMMQRRLYALGRLKPGQMNKTETAYAEHLEKLKQSGEIIWYKFEGITLKLAKRTSLKVDFAVLLPDGAFELHDVKGARAVYMDDAKVKMKVAAEMYPFTFRVVFPRRKKDGGGWDIEEVNA